MHQAIPLVDLNLQYLRIKDQIDSVINSCISEGNFIKGREVHEFESEFSNYLGAGFCVGCGNGTDALEIILKSLGISAGEEVLVPSLTWIATAEAVTNVGAEPVFVDINADSFTIDVKKLESKITKSTKAIIPVHLYGCPCDMDEILKMAERYGLYVIEDCAQAHGAEYKGRKVGTFGIASAFSFFPSKNLGAFGDAGAVVTDNVSIAERARMISNHGQLNVKHLHSLVGRNSRLDTIQAAILKVKLKYLDIWNDERIAASEYYCSKLKGLDSLRLPICDENRKHVFHLFVIRSLRRDRIIEKFRARNIGSGIHYPKGLPFLEAFSYKNHLQDDFSECHIATSEILSLPMFPGIKPSQIDLVCNSVIDACQ